MRNRKRTFTPRFIKKLSLVFLLLIVLMGSVYIAITGYYGNKYKQATEQLLNAKVAEHLIEEKFREDPPFLEDGSVNKALFGDLMHDMMAINRSIEVYLLDTEGTVLYSVVLDHNGGTSSPKVELQPIREFIASGGEKFILGDDPRNPGKKKIFSAATFDSQGKSGIIYIILAGQEYQLVSDTLLGRYFFKLGLGATLISMIFALAIALLSLWFLTKNLRRVVGTIRKFQDGDLAARIPNPEKSDLEVVAHTFNEMAETIVGHMEKLKSVDQLRRELVANVSHDLRTPLSILKGYIETLQMKGNSISEEERQNYLKIIQSNVDKFSRLIHQLFTYSRLEAEQICPVMEPFSITDLIQDLMAEFKVLADQKQIDLRWTAPKGNCMVFADVSLVEQALQNLIENALKFTEPNGMVILLLEQNNRKVNIKVKDSGHGIPADQQPFIFDRYKQLADQPQRQGQGLGLAIVKKIMELHNTTITVLSRPQEGSTFSFDLPVYS